MSHTNEEITHEGVVTLRGPVGSFAQDGRVTAWTGVTNEITVAQAV